MNDNHSDDMEKYYLEKLPVTGYDDTMEPIVLDKPGNSRIKSQQLVIHWHKQKDFTCI